MILSDREIKLALRRDSIRITPLPSGNAISSSAVDLTLHEEISIWTPRQQDAPVVIYPARGNFDLARLLREHSTTLILPPQGFVLKPGAFVLGWTEELIQLPHTSRLAGRVEGRSSMARLGVGAHVTAPTIHAGFGFLEDPQHIGTQIRLEIWNCGPLHVCLEKGMKICQLILEEVHGTPEKGYEGVFATQAPEGLPPTPPASAPAPRKRQRRR
jgi:dCTP deaminase